MDDGMIVEDAVEAPINAIIDIVHEAPLPHLIHPLPHGMNLSKKIEGRGDIETARLCDYFHTTPFRKELIDGVVDHTSNLQIKRDG